MLSSSLLALALFLTSALALKHDDTPLNIARRGRTIAKRVKSQLDKKQTTCAPRYTNAKTINGTAGLTRPTAFVTRSGNTGFAVSGRAYRPVGPNVYWLGLDENEGGIYYPGKNRIKEAMAQAVAMGANTIRSHTLGISVGQPKSVWPTANKVNNGAWDVIDYSIAAASRYGLRLVIPLTDEYDWYHGGKYTFLRWSGASSANNGAAFYTNRKTIDLYKTYISTIINHRNPYTGIRLGDDPTIMAWETGNELGAYMMKNGAPPAAWTAEIAKHIKSLAPRHLVIDGSDGTQYTNGTPVPGVNVAQVDVITDHAYGLSNSLLGKDLTIANKYKKALLMSEFDWINKNNGNDLNGWLKAVEAQPGTGDMFWSIFGHDEKGCNWVKHNDGYSMYYPNGNSASETSRMLLVAQHFYRMTGRSAPSSLPAVALPQPYIAGLDPR